MLRHLQSEPQKPGRVVVAGAQGFVGGAIAARLARDGVGVLRLTRGELDLLAPDAGQRLKRILAPGDVLVAAAAIAPCRTPEMLRDNMTLALALAEGAADAGLAQLVNIGSDAIYADSPEPLTERSVTAPDTLHGIMHLAREAMLRSAVKAPFASLRPSLLYGARDPHNGYGPNRFRRLANRGEKIVLFGEGEERRDHVLIDDLAELAARVIEHRSEGVLNVATGEVASFRDIARMVVAIAGARVPIEGSKRTGPMPHNGFRPFDIAACRAAFPDFAFTPLEAGLTKAQREDAAR
jgi:UDP-glucose 4-epimerase